MLYVSISAVIAKKYLSCSAHLIEMYQRLIIDLEFVDDRVRERVGGLVGEGFYVDDTFDSRLITSIQRI